jgi:predicted DNA-binding WGR domain protein/photosystem II stability/assembly factor-like uncharacterized protein
MRRFEFVEGGSRKFWEAEARGAELVVSWGRLGTAGRTQLKSFESAEKAEKELAKLVGQKLKKGYQEVGATPAPASAPSRALAGPPPAVAGVSAIGGPAAAPRPLRDYGVEVLVEAGTHPALVLGLAARGKEAIAVGGQGRDLVLVSKDGKKFSTRKSDGHGLRGALYRANDELYVVGEYGYCAVSRDRGKTWTKLHRQPRPWHKGEAPCLFAIVEDEAGRVWTAGDSGYVGRVTPEGDQLEPLKLVDEFLGRIRATPRGLLMPSDDGHLWLVKDEQAEKLPLNAKTMLMAVALTPAGTIVTVGQGGAIFRLPAGAKKAVRVEGAPAVLLTGVDVLADGQVLVVGEGGTILASVDDGASFAPVKHRSKKYLWCCRAHGDGALIGGEGGLILRYAPG